MRDIVSEMVVHFHRTTGCIYSLYKLVDLIKLQSAQTLLLKKQLLLCNHH
jgi:hypothetical protein